MEQQLTRLALVSMLLVTACTGETFTPPNQQTSPLLGGVPRPPLNLPLPPPSVPAEPPSLPAGTQPSLAILADGKPFQGVANGNGKIVASGGALDLFEGSGRILRVLYRLPPGLPPIAAPAGFGNWSITERSTPGGPARQLVVSDKAGVLLAELWMIAVEPISVQAGTGVSLRQRPHAGSSNLTAVQTDVVRQDGTLTELPVGKALQVNAGGASYGMFVENSHWARVAEGGTFIARYLLHVWVVRGQ